MFAPGFRFLFQHDGNELSFDVLKEKGGLIQAFSLTTRELSSSSIVLNRPNVDQMDGSTFWPSPQAADRWGGTDWPPPPEVDVSASIGFSGASATDFSYEAAIDAAAGLLMLTSVLAPRVNMTIKKRFSVDQARGAMVLDYEMINQAEFPASWAPWEITRVAPGGLTFYATGTQPLQWRQPAFAIQEADGISWFKQNASAPEGGKLTSDTQAGFIAHTDGQLLLTKCFAKIEASQAAPGEGQIEIFNGGDYVEVENQGAFEEIAPGKSLRWRVLWFLRRLPPDTKAVAGDQELARFAERMCDN